MAPAGKGHRRWPRAVWRGRYLSPATFLFFGLLTTALANLLFVMGHDPRPRDADADGLLDQWELQQFGSLAMDGTLDSDGDGLSDAAEAAAGASPLCADSDGDGVPDGMDAHPCSAVDADGDGLADDWELWRFGGHGSLPPGDPDGDGRTTQQEWADGTDPARADVPAASRPALALFTPPAA
jgi:hypothetical protein